MLLVVCACYGAYFTADIFKNIWRQILFPIGLHDAFFRNSIQLSAELLIAHAINRILILNYRVYPTCYKMSRLTCQRNAAVRIQENTPRRTTRFQN